jgi:hypothetical protein
VGRADCLQGDRQPFMPSAGELSTLKFQKKFAVIDVNDITRACAVIFQDETNGGLS